MGICRDKAVNYLKGLKLNTITHPRSDVAPLALIGEYKDAIGIIGRLDQLLSGSSAPTPTVQSGAAAEISGKQSSKLPIALGLDILGTVIGAMGGNLGVKAAYDKARTVEFSFKNVTRERANVVEVGDYLMGGEVKWDHLILKKYLFGKGKLYVITEVAKSNEIGVTAYGKDGASLGLDIPSIEGVVGGDVSVGIENERTKTVIYKGATPLAFGFVAIELAADEHPETGELVLTYNPVAAGSVAMSVGNNITAQDFGGPLRELTESSPEALGEA